MQIFLPRLPYVAISQEFVQGDPIAVLIAVEMDDANLSVSGLLRLLMASG